MKVSAALGVGLFSSLLAGAAIAQTETAAPASAPPTVAAAPVKPGAHLHDGFYLRLGTGFGSYGETVRRAGQDQSTTVTGVATVGEWLVGGAVRPGLIVGGGVFTSNVLASDRTVSGATPPDEIAGGQGTFSLVGPFFDYYFNPTKGAHIEAAIGFATVTGTAVTSSSKDTVALGGGAVIGAGYEWWLSDNWSVGVLGRMAVGWVTGRDNADVRWYRSVGASPSVLFTATFN
jgi:hypothetical protein